MKYTIATLASHSCLQILKGAKDEGFQTLAVATSKNASFYKRFKFIDEVVEIESFAKFYDLQKSFLKKNIIIIPHGSFVAYLGKDYDKKLELAHYGNKKVLIWEGDRIKQREWLQKAGLKQPRIFSKPSEIDRTVMVKLHGAKGGSGYFIVRDKVEFEKKIESLGNQKYLIQEYIVGVPVYLQFFYSRITKEVELLGIDRRYESNVDGIGRLPASFQDSHNSEPSYTVVGNFPIVIRESLLPETYKMAEQVINTSQKLIPEKGLYGPFCLETIVTPDCQFYTIEISCRIVAGTNLFTNGSAYADLQYDVPMSTGRRIAREIKEAIRQNRLAEILD